jgi:hypothetical protein
MRAGDSDRDRVAERLRLALDEGRLNLHEYDERLQQAYLARTFGELDTLLADLPVAAGPVVPASPAAPARAAGWRSVAGPDGTYPGAGRRWLIQLWDPWLGAVGTCVGIWVVLSLLAGHVNYFWPGWVAGPWGAFLLVGTVRGLLRGEPQRWAAKQARQAAEREVRRQARERDRASGADT